MKKMGLLFLLIGFISLALSAYFFTNKQTSKTNLNPISKQEIETNLPPESKQKGNEFEDYIIQLLGKLNQIKFIGKVSDYHKNGVSATENKEPDLKFKYQNTPFAVECKWRNSFVNGKINWAKDYQINNYLNYQNTKKEKVYVAIGIGGNPNAPEKLYLVPLFRLTKEFANQEYIKEFEITTKDKALQILKNNSNLFVN